MKQTERKQNTRQAIFDAYCALLEQKPPEKISVIDVCRHAKISRATFYLHYEDIHAMLDDFSNHFFSEVDFSRLFSLPLSDTRALQDAIIPLLRLIEANETLYRCTILERGGSRLLFEKMQARIDELIHSGLREKQLPVSSSCLSHFAQSTFHAIVLGWLDDDRKQPLEDVAFWIARC